MSYAKVDVTRPSSSSPGAGGDKKENVYIFDMSDVSSYSRDADDLTTTTIVMKSGKYAIKVGTTVSSIDGSYKGEGEEDAEGFMHNVKFDHPGNAAEILAFINNWTGKNCGVMIESCKTGQITVYGTPCAPLRLVASGTDNKDAKKQSLEFKSNVKAPYSVGILNGTPTFSTATTVSAAATNIDLTNGSGRYQLTTGSSSAAAIATISNATDGMVFTLVGSGGAYPSTIAGTGTPFLMKNGAAWSALAGAEITFKVFKDGASSYKAIELSRV